MRSFRQIARSGLFRDIALVCAADTMVGAAFGAVAVSSGLPLWVPVALSVAVFAGAAQFLFVGVLAAGGNPAAAVATALLVNVRLVPLGLAVGDLLGTGWLRRLVGSHLITDESVAFAVVQDRPDLRRAAFWGCGLAVFGCWNLGVVVGAVGGAAVTDPDALGLDAAFPAVLLALVVPSLRVSSVRRVAVVGAVVAVGCAPFLPVGLPVLLALGALLLLRRPLARGPAAAGPPMP